MIKKMAKFDSKKKLSKFKVTGVKKLLNKEGISAITTVSQKVIDRFS